jgi:hypothetical protein
LTLSRVEVIACKPARVGVKAVGLLVVRAKAGSASIYESP